MHRKAAKPSKAKPSRETVEPPSGTPAPPMMSVKFWFGNPVPPRPYVHPERHAEAGEGRVVVNRAARQSSAGDIVIGHKNMRNMSNGLDATWSPLLLLASIPLPLPKVNGLEKPEYTSAKLPATIITVYRER